jgi:uncharacterized protein YcbK (DUF882 family)
MVAISRDEPRGAVVSSLPVLERDRVTTDPIAHGAEAPGRREFLAASCAAAVALLLGPRDARAAATPRRLSFVNTHTDESLSVVYWAEGRYEPQALHDINFILRDYRAEVVKDIDHGLIDLVHALRTRLRSDAPFHVISGYRTPETNRMLRERSGRVASHSMHIEGRAIDLRLPGTPLDTVHRAALALRGGGVGYYRASDFVHVDTGSVRAW